MGLLVPSLEGYESAVTVRVARIGPAVLVLALFVQSHLQSDGVIVGTTLGLVSLRFPYSATIGVETQVHGGNRYAGIGIRLSTVRPSIVGCVDVATRGFNFLRFQGLIFSAFRSKILCLRTVDCCDRVNIGSSSQYSEPRTASAISGACIGTIVRNTVNNSAALCHMT